MSRVAVCVAILALVSTPSVWAQTSYDDESTAEGWAWSQIRRDSIADFNEKCGRNYPEGIAPDQTLVKLDRATRRLTG